MERMKIQTSSSSSSDMLEMFNGFLINGYGKKSNTNVRTQGSVYHTHSCHTLKQEGLKVVTQRDASSTVSSEHLASLSFYPLK